MPQLPGKKATKPNKPVDNSLPEIDFLWNFADLEVLAEARLVDSKAAKVAFAVVVGLDCTPAAAAGS